MILKLLGGVFIGFVASMPPGPSSYILMGHAATKRYRLVLKDLAGILGAELLVIAAVLLFLEPIESWSKTGLPQILASIFMGISLLYLNRPLRARKGSTFILALLNPGLWISMLGFLIIAKGLFDLNIANSVYFMLAIEVGGMCWFTTCALIASNISKNFRTWMLRLSYFGISTIAIVLFLKGISIVKPWVVIAAWFKA